MSSGASSQTAAETPERSSVRIGHEALTPTALDYADADDDADDYDYDSGTEGPSEIVYAPEDDVDPSDNSGVNSDDPSDSDDDENDVPPVLMPLSTCGKNFRRRTSIHPAVGNMMVARWRQPTTLQH